MPYKVIRKKGLYNVPDSKSSKWKVKVKVLREYFLVYCVGADLYSSKGINQICVKLFEGGKDLMSKQLTVSKSEQIFVLNNSRLAVPTILWRKDGQNWGTVVTC